MPTQIDELGRWQTVLPHFRHEEAISDGLELTSYRLEGRSLEHTIDDFGPGPHAWPLLEKGKLI